MTGIGPGMMLLVAVAGGVGAGLRFWIDALLRGRAGPHPTAVINVSGSFLLGLLTQLAAASVLAPGVAVVVGTGLLGGYTTFSTAMVETVTIAREGRRLAALGQGLGMLLAAVAAAALGAAVAFGVVTAIGVPG